MVDQIERNGPDRAQSAMIERGLAIAFDFDETIAFDVQQHPATAVTAAADAFKDHCRLAHEERNRCAALSARLIRARQRQCSFWNLRYHQNEELERSIGSRDLRGFGWPEISSGALADVVMLAVECVRPLPSMRYTS